MAAPHGLSQGGWRIDISRAPDGGSHWQLRTFTDQDGVQSWSFNNTPIDSVETTNHDTTGTASLKITASSVEPGGLVDLNLIISRHTVSGHVQCKGIGKGFKGPY